MTDIFANWKGNKFVVSTLPQDEQYTLYGGLVVVLTDIGYWNTHYEELKDWCDENSADTHGMTVTIPNTKVLTAFCLRWA